jgi:hypothetical protein
MFWQCGIFVFLLDSCSDSVVFLFSYYIEELFWQCGIFVFHSLSTTFLFYLWAIQPLWCFWQCGNMVIFLLDFRTVLTVWYFCFPIRFYNCSDSVVFLFSYYIQELFWQCGIFVFLLYWGTVLTVWYFCFSFSFYDFLIIFMSYSAIVVFYLIVILQLTVVHHWIL